MYALVKQDDGKWYDSTVFGYYDDVKSTDDYQRYTDDYQRYKESIETPYYVVFDPERKCLRKQFMFPSNLTGKLSTHVLIIDSDTSGWKLNPDGTGGVDFLPRRIADEIIASGTISADIFEKCKEVETSYVYEEYPEVVDERSIRNLQEVAGGFHDGHIAKAEKLDDGRLYLLFTGIWGCSIEIWFWGDLEYDLAEQDPKVDDDAYWSDSTVLIQDGFVWFVNEEDLKAEDIKDGYCWFKARHMMYHVVPK